MICCVLYYNKSMELKQLIREYKQKTGITDSEIARRSVNLLLDMMEKGAAPRHILVDAAFRKRESIAPCNRA